MWDNEVANGDFSCIAYSNLNILLMKAQRDDIMNDVVFIPCIKTALSNAFQRFHGFQPKISHEIVNGRPHLPYSKNPHIRTYVSSCWPH